MSNPTLGAGSQFQSPFNILPDSNLISLNSTTVSISQFNSPFNILPDVMYTNPTLPYTSQLMPQNSGNNIGAAGSFVQAAGLAVVIPTYYNPTVDQTTLGLNPQLQDNGDGPMPYYTGNPSLLNSSSYTYESYVPDSATISKRAGEGNQRTSLWSPGDIVGGFTNLDNTRTLSEGAGYATAIAAGALGFPQIGQSAQNVFNFHSGDLTGRYFTLPFDQLTNKINLNSGAVSLVNSIGSLSPYPDFRAKKVASAFSNPDANLAAKLATAVTNARKDGASAAFRPGNFSGRASLYAAAAVSPAGAYTLFNLNGVGEYGYGYGDHDSNYALLSDFTLRSEVSTTWKFGKPATDITKAVPGRFYKTRNRIESVTPFRGDKVTVIDFGRRLLKNAYQWKPSRNEQDKVNKTALTKDFIKFFLTGPSLTANKMGSEDAADVDDIIVFRAILTSLSDSFSPNWSEVKMIGRADPNYQYSGYARSLSIGFDVVITDRDEIKPVWRKLNALAGYCAPTYDPASIAMTAPWMRITLGDLFHQTPVVMTSLGYTYDLDHSWEINIEGDKEMFETPRKISVSCDFNVISDYLPQKGGRFFNLAKRYDGATNMPIEGNDNWLSDFTPVAPDPNFRQGGATLNPATPSTAETFEQRVENLTAFTGPEGDLDGTDEGWPLPQ
jgi:hypothetical protein